MNFKFVYGGGGLDMLPAPGVVVTVGARSGLGAKATVDRGANRAQGLFIPKAVALLIKKPGCRGRWHHGCFRLIVADCRDGQPEPPAAPPVTNRRNVPVGSQGRGK